MLIKVISKHFLVDKAAKDFLFFITTHLQEKSPQLPTLWAFLIQDSSATNVR